jgi:lipooligosaccharide transport system ATP-binding protein
LTNAESPPDLALSIAVEARGLRKEFDGLVAVDSIDFQVLKGECFGFLGPNGAGKTTTMKMIYCASPRTSGRLLVEALDVDTFPRETKAKIGVSPQEENLDPDFTVFHNLIAYSRYFDIPRRVAEARAEKLLDFVALKEKRDVVITELSGGMKKRLILARALLSEPKIVILDEPTTGLDPQARHLIWDRLEELRRQGVTIILTTQYMEEAARLCDRLIVMDKGKIIEQGTPQSLVEKHVAQRVLEIPAEPEVIIELEKLGSALFDEIGGRLHIYTNQPETILADLQKRHAILRSVIRDATLEDVFFRLTGRELRD